MNNFWEAIEEPIRDIVRFLRDNGFNTTCSCGHEMTVELGLLNHMDEVERMANLLVENGYKGFKIECTVRVPPDGLWDRRAIIHFNDWM